MSYMEIYNEEINDLLAPEHRKLQIHENLERGIFVAGLKEEIVATPEQVIDLMDFGESHRHIGETNMNVYSSRSHTIFRMIIESRVRTEDDSDNAGISCDAVRVSVLNLVDLAGSERAAKTGAEGMRLKEGSHINKSLMTLGTVIKKLSEGVESQGGHVPYRDSKLTRILQPSLGGNANTAIICNITLAQVHADETKSSLQFANRALRVTNCARVNEILTDAALLKRQKKEIEELRERLQGSHAEHFEEEIRNLRNTLLQSELDRERIALELQEEKKAQALRERRLQEQAKKIENLSSLVLNSSIDETRFTQKKDKRRETWCPSIISHDAHREVSTTTHWEASVGEPKKHDHRNMGLPIPFEELMTDEPVTCGALQDHWTPLEEECTLLDARSLVNVTSRRKVQTKNSLENSEGMRMCTEYDNILVENETQGMADDIETECLTGSTISVEKQSDGRSVDNYVCQLNGSTSTEDGSLTSKESESICIIKLQEQIKMLETEKLSLQQKLELATQQNIVTGGKCGEICEEHLKAHGEYPRQAVLETIEENDVEFETEILSEVEEISSEIECSRRATAAMSSFVDELFKSFVVLSHMFLDLKSCSSDNYATVKSIMCNHKKICHFMEKRIAELETDKSSIYTESIDLHNQIQELQQNFQESERIFKERCQQQDLERIELLSHIENLEKEVSGLSSGALAKEKEALRKELEKTKAKLKETDFKLKNAIQEKTKLEGEKAHAEREIKKLQGQKSLLERDICKRESLVGKRNDSIADRRRESKAFDTSKARVHAAQNAEAMQGEYKKLEVLAFEMETTIASLEDQLAAVNQEKEEAFQENEILSSELDAMSNRLGSTSSELEILQGELSSIKTKLTESESSQQKMESSISLLQEEKAELAMQLTDALLELEEEKAIWSTKEKASIDSVAERSKMYSAELALLAKELLEVRHELENCEEEREILRERLHISEENAEWEKKCSLEKSSEIDQMRIDLKVFESQREDGQNVRLELEVCKEECETLRHRLSITEQKSESERKSSQEKSSVIDQLRQELKMFESERGSSQNDIIKNMNDMAKLKMRLRYTQAKLEAFRGRYDELVKENALMDLKFREASKDLKEKLASIGVENFQLKRRLVERNSVPQPPI